MNRNICTFQKTIFLAIFQQIGYSNNIISKDFNFWIYSSFLPMVYMVLSVYFCTKFTYAVVWQGGRHIVL